MDNVLCKRFDTLRSFLPDELNASTKNDFHNNGDIRDYCPNGSSGNTKECKTDFDKIKAGCLWLFEQLFVKNKKNISTVEYIIIWLSYKLNQKTYEGITNLNDFYAKYIENNTHYTNCKQGGKDCSKSLKDNTGYKNYKEIIDKRKELLSTNFEYIPKFYDAFKPLCNMYTELDANDTTNKEYLENAKEFIEKYKNLLNNNDAYNKDSPYYQVLSTLSNDYNGFKKYCGNSNIDCSDIPKLPDIKTKENGVHISEPSSELSFEMSSEVTPSSSSVTNKLIPVLSIIVAIPIFLGIFYKFLCCGSGVSLCLWDPYWVRAKHYIAFNFL
ncbi:hypothetical protein YYC_00272 [Plasmodium yoelii 17X]|uniref:Uncharacterized protein n=1 Tax=Plasmodium yoelii 17X TaxID=1323249 RepID=V7PUA7_PLAYE|nr:hypothetical protein YYC_00272 [Plasmodium yoelii 17X]